MSDADSTAEALAVVAALRSLRASVATAESLTAGLLCATLVDVPGASEVVRGGIVAYAADLKVSLLGVPADLIARVGTVDPDTAKAMATGVRSMTAGDYGLATTGVAGPELVEGKPVGLAFAAVAGPDGTRVRRLVLAGDRQRVRRGATAAALRLLLEVLRGDGRAG